MWLVGDPHLRNGVWDKNVGAERRARPCRPPPRVCSATGILRRPPLRGSASSRDVPSVSSVRRVAGAVPLDLSVTTGSLPRRAELGSTIRGTGVKGLFELGSRDVALFSTVHCNVALIRRIQPSRREKYWVSDPGTGVAHPSFRSASRGVRDGATLHGFRWWPVTPAWWLAPVNVALSRRRQGWLAPVNSAPSPSSLLRRKVQRSRFGVPCRGSCSWPRSRMPAAMVKCNVRPGCTVGADRSMVCTVNHRSCPASGPHPAPRRARQQTRS